MRFTAVICALAALPGCTHDHSGGASPGAISSADAASAAHEPPQTAAVTVRETADAFFLSNGILTVGVSKKSGNMLSITYKGVETLGEPAGSRPYMYWSHDVVGAKEIVTSVTIDPSANGGDRAEVSIKGISGGNLMGHGPGTPPEGDLPVDIDIRYALSRDDSAVYTYTAFDHRAEYDAGDFSEARIAGKLSSIFTHIHVDTWRSGRYPLFNEGTDKYVYVSRQWENRAYGWTAPDHKLGFFLLAPSPEFLSGGPTKAEFLAHGTSPIVLSYWRSSHNGGANVSIEKGERWQRVIGPFAMYVTQGETPEAMWADARARLMREEAAWPYAWVDAPGYATPEERGSAYGEFRLDDPLSPSGEAFRGDLYVGLTKTPYELQEPGGPRTITWQNSGKDYQFWTRVTERSGRFAIPDVPAGTYTLHAFADGVLGEYSKSGIEISQGGAIDLGDLNWTPQRYGRQVWEIGTPDRNALEFAGADRFFVPGQPLRYAQMFPHGIDYMIGQSSPLEDWHYSHMPQGTNPLAEIVPFRGVAGEGGDAPRTIHFDMPSQPSGRAVLRIAVNGTGSRPVIDLAVNGAPQGRIGFGRDDGSMKRHQINGIWKLIDTEFDASLLRAGGNTITLTVPAGSLNDGVIYDYLRLEIAEAE